MNNPFLIGIILFFLGLIIGVIIGKGLRTVNELNLRMTKEGIKNDE